MEFNYEICNCAYPFIGAQRAKEKMGELCSPRIAVINWGEKTHPPIFNCHHCLCHIWAWSNVIEYDQMYMKMHPPRDLPGLPHEYCQELARFQSNKSNNSHLKDFTQFPRRPCFLLYLKPLWLKKRYNLQDMFLHLVCAGKNKHLTRTWFWGLI